MKKKWIVIIVVAVVLVAGYTVYAKFFLEHVAVGGLCEGSAMCDGECLGFGDLLPDYSHEEICTRACSAPADCPAGTACEQVQVVSSDGKGTNVEDKRYCLPAGAKK